MNTEKSARLIAFYLPQFHPIPENDEWWGKGFTEWTNVAKARPLFPGHYQPHLPADLGFYDLRLPEVREAQADLARQYGIEGFCYWHYWFAGKRLLERPFNETLHSGEPNFPFCLGWANETWSGIWHGAPDRILIEQTYPDLDDHEKHFYELIDAFGDDRYIKFDGKPIFVIYKPHKLPDSNRVTDFWRTLALKSGLKGLHIVAVLQSEQIWDPIQYGFDAITISNQGKVIDIAKRNKHQGGLMNRVRMLLARQNSSSLMVYPYREAIHYFIESVPSTILYHPCVIPNWDNSPRSGHRGLVLHDSTPELFRLHLKEAIERVATMPVGQKLIFLKSWNEWAEGNHLEPDLRFGHAYLEAIRDEILVVQEKKK